MAVDFMTQRLPPGPQGYNCACHLQESVHELDKRESKPCS